MPHRGILRFAAALALLAPLGCGSPTGSAGPAAALQIVSGDQQLAVVGTAPPLPLVVKAVRGDGSPAAGQPVSFRVISGGGTVSAATAATDAQGLARALWTVGTVAADSQRAEARAGSDGPGVVFHAVARADNAKAAASVAGNDQTGTAGTTLLDSLAVMVRDQYGNPVAGAAVSFHSTAGGGTLSPAEARTGAGGVARAAWTLGSAVGPQAAEALTPQGGVPFHSTATAVLPPPPAGAAPQVRLDSAWVRESSAAESIGGSEIAAIGQVTWNPGQNPTIWFEWSAIDPSLFFVVNVTQPGVITGGSPTSVAFQSRLASLGPHESTTVYYRIVASNSFGVTRSAIKRFTTPP